MKVLRTYVAIIIFMIILINNCTYASMADFTDEDAEKITEKMIHDHEKEFDSNKSDNNYLKEIIVNGGEISPSFDRQIVEYSVKIDSKLTEIDITATPEDNRAKVNGTGKIDIINNSEFKIEVIAESGTTRTYFIKVVKSDEDNKESASKEDNTVKNELLEDDLENIEIINNNLIEEDEASNEVKNNRIKIYI